MTSYRLAWLSLIAQRDGLYIQLAAAVLVGGGLFLFYHHLWPRLAVKMAVIVGVLTMTGAIFTGFLLWV